MTDALRLHGVRYQVKDVSRAVAFYTTHLGFKLEHQQLPAFASVSLDDVQVLLSGPGASGSRPMPDGRPQVPGGWNRVVLRVADLPSCIESLKQLDCPIRSALLLKYEILRSPAEVIGERTIDEAASDKGCELLLIELELPLPALGAEWPRSSFAR